MIYVESIKLINWYGFQNAQPIPFGQLTMFYGRNASGKTTAMDAFTYAIFGDTVFNASADAGQSQRTISSYTRQYDVDRHTYLRPANQFPNVFTHIAVDWYDEVNNKRFVLGTVIETDEKNNTKTSRYILNDMTTADIQLTYETENGRIPYDASGLQKEYNLRMMGAQDGVAAFMQKLGLRLEKEQISKLARKLRSVKKYDPKIAIEEFIRNNVVEEQDIDLSKFIEKKRRIGQLQADFDLIDKEIRDLDKVLDAFDAFKAAEKKVKINEIKIAYAEKLGYENMISECALKQEEAQAMKYQADNKAAEYKKKFEKAFNEAYEAKQNLERLDRNKAKDEAKKRLHDLEEEKAAVFAKKDVLEAFQTNLSELIHWMLEDKREPVEKEILSSICSDRFSAKEKDSAVRHFRDQMELVKERCHGELVSLDNNLAKIRDDEANLQNTIDACNNKRVDYNRIQNYVNLKNDINEEFHRQEIPSEAFFACEKVIHVDEDWQDVIEFFLNQNRYIVMVEPKYFEKAFRVFLKNRSTRYAGAHIMNTQFLMEDNIVAKRGSVAEFLEIKDPIVKKYFDSKLGHIMAVSPEQVKDYRYAMAADGTWSIAGDCSCRSLKNINSYYMGRNAIDRNKKRAEKELADLREEYRMVLAQRDELSKKYSYLVNETTCLIRQYDYDACAEYEKVEKDLRKASDILKELEASLQDDREYLQLKEVYNTLEKNKNEIQAQRDAELKNAERYANEYNAYLEKQSEAMEDKERSEEILAAKKEENPVLFRQAVEDYEKRLAEDENSSGGVLTSKTMQNLRTDQKKAEEQLLNDQISYNAQHPTTTIDPDRYDETKYRDRRQKIWVEDREEIKIELDEQKRLSEDLFKRSFVLEIRRKCRNAISDISAIDLELRNCNFDKRYSIRADYKKDGSDFQKILDYALYLKEDSNIGNTDEQTVMDEAAKERGLELEHEVEQIVSRIISDDELMRSLTDYRNYLNYQVSVNDSDLGKSIVSGSGAEVQIPTILICISALLMVYNHKSNSTRLVFIDEPFVKMDGSNIKKMIDFMKRINVQVIFCAPDKLEAIGSECDVIIPFFKRNDQMYAGTIEFLEAAELR